MVRILLVTANVGSVFENLEKGLDIWMTEFISVMRSKEPEFVGIHFQETGGKNYENGSNCIDIFFGQLVEQMREIKYTRAEGFVDSRSDLEDQFTALSSVYFVHESVHPKAVAIWDFQEKCFKELQSKVHIGPELQNTTRKEKEKFPQNFYPNCKWSRKGFLRTRWFIEGRIIDLVNIHLFHDSDNLIAASAFPSQFAQHRQRTLTYTLNRLQNDPTQLYPLFIFGDFNFRVNTHGVMTQLQKEYDASSIKVGAKKFHCPDQELRFLHSYDWLKQFDFELENQEGLLSELDLNFHPSYPFEESETEAEKFLRTRCPSWCDRVLFTHQTKDIISQESPAEYNILGSKACMGDHKPVYLSFTLDSSNPNCTNCIPGPIPAEQGFQPTDKSKLSIASSTSTINSTSTGCKKCKCLVSLLKCNLSFTKCKKQSVSSDSVSINPGLHSNHSKPKSDSDSGKLPGKLWYKGGQVRPWREDKIKTEEVNPGIESMEIETQVMTDKPKICTDDHNQIIPISQVLQKQEFNLQLNNVIEINNAKNVHCCKEGDSNLGVKNTKLEFGKPFRWVRPTNSSANGSTGGRANIYSNSSSCSKRNGKSENSAKQSLCAKCVLL